MINPYAFVASVNPATIAALKYWIDAGAIAGVADAGAVTAAKVVDQSASARGAALTVTNLVYRANAGNGKPSIEFNGTDSDITSPDFALATPLTIFAVVKRLAGYSGNEKWMMDGTTFGELSVLSNTPNPGISLGSSAKNTTNYQADLNTLRLLQIKFNGASSTFSVNGDPDVTGNPGAAGLTHGIYLGGPGNKLGGYFGNYQLLELMLCDSTLSAGDATSLRSYLMTKHTLGTHVAAVVCDGNSMTQGTNNTAGHEYPTLLQTGLGNTYRVANVGVSGNTTTQRTTAAPTSVDVNLAGASKVIDIFWEITNDIANGSNATTAYNNVVSYCSARRTAGVKVIVVTCIARTINNTPWTATMDGYRTTVNANIVANWATFADALLDLAGDSRFQNPADTTYYNGDGLHPNDTGAQLVATLAQPVVASL